VNGGRVARSALAFALTLTTLALLPFALGGCRRSNESTPAPAATSSAAEAPDAGPAFVLPADRFSEEGMLAEATLYLDHPEHRRAALVDSLANPKNTYSRQRLDAYALQTRGWDLLPEWNPQSVPATTAMAAELRAHRPLSIAPETPRVWDGKRPTTMAAWVALGREVFFGYPLRVEIFMNWALEHPDVGERVGVRAAKDGTYPGVRLFTSIEGKTSLGITCAVCHTSVDSSGHVIVGDARRAFDYGALRLAYHKDTGVPVDPDLARRMKSWGPGRADVTEDDDEDPVAIPDLWGLRHQTALTQAGTIKHTGPTVLAIRQETQLLHSNHQKVRPPRELAYALALFLYSLAPEASAPRRAGEAALVPHGKALFADNCKGCHSNAALGGPPMPAEKIGTDRALAFGGARGTGKYRPPALLRVSAAAPYFHQGAVPTLEDVLSPARLEPSYANSPLAKGAVAGHAYGTDLPASDRAALVAYLRSL
jgi:mono/diheme cytochrome c family protein